MSRNACRRMASTKRPPGKEGARGKSAAPKGSRRCGPPGHHAHATPTPAFGAGVEPAPASRRSLAGRHGRHRRVRHRQVRHRRARHRGRGLRAPPPMPARPRTVGTRYPAASFGTDQKHAGLAAIARWRSDPRPLGRTRWPAGSGWRTSASSTAPPRPAACAPQTRAAASRCAARCRSSSARTAGRPARGGRLRCAFLAHGRPPSPRRAPASPGLPA